MPLDDSGQVARWSPRASWTPAGREDSQALQLPRSPGEIVIASVGRRDLVFVFAGDRSEGGEHDGGAATPPNLQPSILLGCLERSEGGGWSEDQGGHAPRGVLAVCGPGTTRDHNWKRRLRNLEPRGMVLDRAESWYPRGVSANEDESSEIKWAKSLLAAHHSSSSEANAERDRALQSLIRFERDVQSMHQALKRERLTFSFYQRESVQHSQSTSELRSIFDFVIEPHFGFDGPKELGTLSFGAVIGGYAKLTYGKTTVAEGPTDKLKLESIPAIMTQLRAVIIAKTAESWLQDGRQKDIEPLSFADG
jgi:hypothetical protein